MTTFKESYVYIQVINLLQYVWFSNVYFTLFYKQNINSVAAIYLRSVLFSTAIRGNSFDKVFLIVKIEIVNGLH